MLRLELMPCCGFRRHNHKVTTSHHHHPRSSPPLTHHPPAVRQPLLCGQLPLVPGVAVIIWVQLPVAAGNVIIHPKISCYYC